MSHLGCKGLEDACDLRSNQIAVAPIVPRFRRCASERPQPDAFVIDAKRSAKLRIIPSGSDRNLAEQLTGARSRRRRDLRRLRSAKPGTEAGRLFVGLTPLALR